jgi:hypothetical protein
MIREGSGFWQSVWQSNGQGSGGDHELPGLKAQFKSTEEKGLDRTDKSNGPREAGGTQFTPSGDAGQSAGTSLFAGSA